VSGYTPTTTAFTIATEKGAFTELNGKTVTTQNVSKIVFFKQISTAASAVVSFVNADATLSKYISAASLDAGSSNIVYSTAEDTDWGNTLTYSGVNNFNQSVYGYYLVDGLNYIASASFPTFTLKTNLSLGSNTTLNGFDFSTSGESLIFTPTTIEQVSRFINVLAVSGFTTLGEANLSEDNSTLQLSTNTFGGNGFIQVTGGNANSSLTSLLNSYSLITSGTNIYVQSTIDAGATGGFLSGQYVKLQNSFTLPKTTGFADTDTLSYTSGSNLIQITPASVNSANSRYFGNPRLKQTVVSKTFKIEKQGILTCLSWNGTGSSPNFNTSVNFNISSGNIVVAQSNGITTYTAATGAANFSECCIDDLITISNFTNASNNGTYLVSGVSNDGTTLSVKNGSGISETIAVGSVSFVCKTGIAEGDIIVIDSSSNFTPNNHGSFKVVRGPTDSNTNSIWYYNPNTYEETVTASTSQANYSTSNGTIAITGGTCGGTMILSLNSGSIPSWVTRGDEVVLTGFSNTANNGTFVIVNVVDSSHLELMNAGAIVETAVSGATITINKSPIKFYEYDAVLAGDNFVSNVGTNSTTLNPDNGTYLVSSVKNKYTLVTSNTVPTTASAVLTNQSSNIRVQEGTPYVGYKRISFLTYNPQNVAQALVLFDTYRQYNKIGTFSSASGYSTAMSAVNKLNFNTSIQEGQFSYRYDTGLVGEANRICYGDQTDVTTYPGVVASGAEIFIKTPLVKRIKVSLSMRIYAGIPFTTVSYQVQSAIASYVDANPIGQSIPISALITTAMSVSGVLSVVVDSPDYGDVSPGTDEITLNSGEKAWVLSLNDITINELT
jgi:hypothetical protein